jgi:hypothetical protein
MTPAEILQRHQVLCDEIHQLTLEENRFLKQNQRVPDSALREKKQSLLSKLDESVASIKQISQMLQAQDPSASKGLDHDAVEKLRSRIMQILLLDRENEQLLFRYSLSGTPKQTNIPPSPSRIQQLYGNAIKPT